jgi:hypothetical protein
MHRGLPHLEPDQINLAPSLSHPLVDVRGRDFRWFGHGRLLRLDYRVSPECD